MTDLKDRVSKTFISQEFEYFSKFLGKYSIFALAIGTILGQVSKDVVNTLVTGIISPGISLLLPNKQFGEWKPSVNGVEFLVGDFLDSVVQMLVTMLVIYIVARYLFRKLDLIGVDKPTKESKKASKKKLVKGEVS